MLRALAQRGGQHHLAAGFDDGSVQAPTPTEIVPGLEARAARDVTLDTLLKRHAPDRLHLHNVVNPLALEQAAARGALLTIQDHRFFCPGRGKLTGAGEVCDQPMSATTCARCFDDARYFDQVLSLTRRRLDAARGMAAITVLSDYMKRELVRAGVEARRVHVIPPFVDGLDQAATPAGPPCALFVGRLVEAKGVRDAIAAWRSSRVRLPLVLAGTGSLRAALEGEQHQDIELRGWVPHHQLAALYARARVLIFPPRWQEPFGIVGLEALFMGVPVAAWQSGGVREWFPGTTLPGWGDVDALAELICASAERSGEAAEGFDRDLLMERLIALYDGRRRTDDE